MTGRLIDGRDAFVVDLITIDFIRSCGRREWTGFGLSSDEMNWKKREKEEREKEKRGDDYGFRSRLRENGAPPSKDRTTDELILSKVHRGRPQATTCRLFTALMAAQFAGDSTATDSRPTKDI